MRELIAILATTAAFLIVGCIVFGVAGPVPIDPMGAMRLAHLSAPYHQSIPLWIPG